MNPIVEKVTDTIRKRSEATRRAYIDKIDKAGSNGINRSTMSCSNLAHGIAACSESDKTELQQVDSCNIAIVSAYNDMLSAHQPYELFPNVIREAARTYGAFAQFAGGVPAMCDGVTQGEAGMELSLFSRDTIAMATAVALSHNMFDGVMCLGICDKIVPGLLIGALSFGHLPVVFAPAGPMPSGLPNKSKAKIREDYAAGRADRGDLLAAESASYHSPGTCTFYGTANSNQMLMEFMGLQLPGGSFVNPGTALRDALTREAARQVIAMSKQTGKPLALARVLDEKALVNGIIGLLATGGSTNHTIHLVAIAKAAGIQINWSDFSELSSVIPLLTRIYPNGMADVNDFHRAGGLGFVISQLLEAGLLHDDVTTILGAGLESFIQVPKLEDESVTWEKVEQSSGDRSIVRGVNEPFQEEGGLRLVEGNLGRAIVKVSAVAKAHRKVSAPARVFSSQSEFAQAFEAGELDRNLVAVVRFQGPRANGMPELHKLTPYLGVLQNKGYEVALLTDGRMSGASGKVLAAIQLTPEAADHGLIACIKDGDLITIDAEAGILESTADMSARQPALHDPKDSSTGMGRELFAPFRQLSSTAEAGATIF